MIDATENCKVKTIDVPGTFMQADMDDLVHVCFTGEMVDKLLDIDHEWYEPCYDNGTGSACSICGIIKSTIWYTEGSMIILEETMLTFN